MKERLKVDTERIIGLLQETHKQMGQPHPFFDDAAYIIDQIDDRSAAEGIMALHMVSVGIAELLSKRSCSAKLCLLAGLGMVNNEVHMHLLQTFEMAFVPNRPSSAPQVPAGIEHIIGHLLSNLPKGSTVIPLTKASAKVLSKMKGKKGKPQPPPNPLLN
jgi:hypothetical protein